MYLIREQRFSEASFSSSPTFPTHGHVAPKHSTVWILVVEEWVLRVDHANPVYPLCSDLTRLKKIQRNLASLRLMKKFSTLVLAFSLSQWKCKTRVMGQGSWLIHRTVVFLIHGVSNTVGLMVDDILKFLMGVVKCLKEFCSKTSTFQSREVLLKLFAVSPRSGIECLEDNMEVTCGLSIEQIMFISNNQKFRTILLQYYSIVCNP